MKLSWKNFKLGAALAALLGSGIAQAQSASPTPPYIGCIGTSCSTAKCQLLLHDVWAVPTYPESGKSYDLSGYVKRIGTGCGQNIDISAGGKSITITTSAADTKFVIKNYMLVTGEHAGGAWCTDVTATENIGWLSTKWRGAATDQLYLEIPVNACNDVNVCSTGKYDRYGNVIRTSVCDAFFNGNCLARYVPNSCGYGYCKIDGATAESTTQTWMSNSPNMALILMSIYSSGGTGSQPACMNACYAGLDRLAQATVPTMSMMQAVSGTTDRARFCDVVCKVTEKLCERLECGIAKAAMDYCGRIPAPTIAKSCAETAMSVYTSAGCGSLTQNL